MSSNKGKGKRLADAYGRLARELKDRAWMVHGLCRGRQDLYFIDRNSDNRHDVLLPTERRAKRLCARCPVRRQCLEYGLKEDYGIWGGTLPRERKVGGHATRYGQARTDIDTMLDEMNDQAIELGLVDTEEVA